MFVPDKPFQLTLLLEGIIRSIAKVLHSCRLPGKQFEPSLLLEGKVRSIPKCGVPVEHLWSTCRLPYKPFQPILMLEGKVRSIPQRCFNHVGSRLTCILKTRLERTTRNKHSSLLGPLLSCEETKVLCIRPLVFTGVINRLPLLSVILFLLSLQTSRRG